MKIGKFHIITEKKLQERLKKERQDFYNKLMTKPGGPKTILRKELGID